MTTTSPVARPLPAARHRAPGPWAGRALIGAAALSLLFVVALWQGNGGLAQGGAVSALGRLGGLIASNLLLIQVLLMARIPLLERRFGQDKLARLHRVTGFTSFWLMITHIVLITTGYAADAGTGFLEQGWLLVTTEPGMLLAFAGAVALVAVVVLSIRAARRRLRYESWHLIHLYAYLGVGLALPHQLWTGSDFLDSPLATAYWWSAYLCTLAAVLVFRVGLPLWRSWRHKLRVVAVTPEAPGVVSVHMAGHGLDKLPARAGQFFLWRFLDGRGRTRANPFSLSAVPQRDRLRITVKDLGDGGARVATLRPGTRVLIEGPYGAVTSAKRSSDRSLLIAAGVGITAMRSLLEELAFQPGKVTLLYRVRSRAEAVFAGELEWFAANRGVNVSYLDGPRGDSWLPRGYGDDVESLYRMVPDLLERDVFLCGPEPWMETVVATLRTAGVPRARIHFERFAW
ncbi:ferredoxin reductase family protein [Allokutzneria sp. A3M-2-11 16]|uniref:ferredoxin reductase family protein n=1 Tax=Allokutzneria sp. A3M-2-11 16 TaxID=2962043 RepID=UPI0020B8DE43|nr:ferredoxin reductase family protein [Allokutzneria sp. A3M-2-11 16]MCP3802762.1 ferredoxin reductase family protein [Allokutzneria sp. A3M-2-11 16]